MADYRLLTYRNGSASACGVMVDGQVYAASDLTGDRRNLLGLLQDWDRTHAAITEAIDDGGLSRAQGVPLTGLPLEAPVQYPGAFFCAGANYWDHLEEMAEFVKKMTGNYPKPEKAPEPWFFVKTTRGTIIGPDAPARIPAFSKQLDWEAELGVVIGRRTRNIDESEALSAVAGYLIVNDLSARDLMRREGSPFIYDWIGQKCFDDAAPTGPWLTPAALIGDPQKLAVKLSVNGAVKQSSNTSQMVHSIAEQVAYLSRHVTLYPGDMIATGTPAGVGVPKGEFLKPGDRVEIEIEGLGTLVNTMVAEGA